MDLVKRARWWCLNSAASRCFPGGEHARTAPSSGTSCPKVTAMRTYADDGYVVSGNRAFVVWRLDIDHAEWGTMNMTQVAIQEWKDGRIVREKFVYW